MRLGYFTMPVHPMHRNWAETLQEDREAIILADKLGFYDAFMGEHLTDKAENITNSMIFHATLISRHQDDQARHRHQQSLAHASGADRRSTRRCSTICREGRFIFGVSPGALTSDAEALGILEQDRNKMFAEAIDVILAIWERDPPYDIDFPDNRYKVSTSRTQALDIGVGFLGKPYQKPRPEIVGTVVAPFSPGVVLMGKRDFHPLSANFLLSKHLKSHWENYCKGKAEVGRQAGRQRLARGAHDLRRRRRQDRGALRAAPARTAPTSSTGRRCMYKMKRGKRLYVFKSHKDQPDDEITLDYVMDNCVIHGSVNKVVDQIARAARGDRRLRRDRLCRHGLGRSGARQALDATDGGAGDAARQRGDRKVRGGLTAAVLPMRASLGVLS